MEQLQGQRRCKCDHKELESREKQISKKEAALVEKTVELEKRIENFRKTHE